MPPLKRLRESQKQEIAEAYNGGCSLEAASKQFGLSRPVITRILLEAGLVRKPGKLNDQQKQAIVNAYTDGQKSIELARGYKVSQCTIESVLRSNGLDLTRKHLTAAEIETLIYLYTTQDMTTPEIAKDLGFSIVTVCKTLKKAGISVRGSNKFIPDEVTQIVADYVGGESSESIAKRFGVVGSCIARMIKRNGVDIRSQLVPEEIKQRAVDAYRSGIPVREIVNETGLDNKSITVLAKRRGIELRVRRGYMVPFRGQIIQLYQAGKTAEQVASELGLKVGNVRSFLTKSGLSRPPAIANKNAAVARLARLGDKRGLTERRPLANRIRRIYPYYEWKKAVLTRDNSTCQHCGATSHVEADHVYPFAAILHDYQIRTLEQAISCDLLWRVDNGRTLCKSCHKKTPTYGAGAKKYIKPLVESVLQKPPQPLLIEVVFVKLNYI